MSFKSPLGISPRIRRIDKAKAASAPATCDNFRTEVLSGSRKPTASINPGSRAAADVIHTDSGADDAVWRLNTVRAPSAAVRAKPEQALVMSSDVKTRFWNQCSVRKFN